MEVFHQFSAWVWTDSFWLPFNLTWNDVKPTKENGLANFNDLYIPIFMGVVFIVFRVGYERLILSRIGRYFGLRDNKKKVTVENPILEKAFKANGRVPYKQIQGLAKQIDWSERRVERWLRQRVSQDKPSILNKFTESGWRVSYYTFIFFFEVYTLRDKSWLWDTKECFRGYPNHPITPDVWWLYMISLSFYWSLIFSQSTDVKRKDSFAMFAHHCSTILLLSFSFTINLTRIGTIVLAIHDIADIFVEAAKMARYIDKEKLCNSLFAIFTVTWIISRLGIYPYVVLYATLYEVGNVVFKDTLDYLSFPPYYILNILLCLLQVLHIVWTFFIMRVLIQTLSVGKVVKDQRSDSSCQSSDGGGRKSSISKSEK